jgi:hypothetical protein
MHYQQSGDSAGARPSMGHGLIPADPAPPFHSAMGADPCPHAQVVASLRGHPRLRVLRQKNRFRRPTPAGFRDLNLNVVLDDRWVYPGGWSGGVG